MKVAIWESIGSMRVVEAPDPVCGATDVKLDIAWCGICGSDVHSFSEGAWIASGQPMGHEYTGVVTEVGDEVQGITIGDRVALNASNYCGTCDHCARGKSALCSNRVGAGPGFAEHVVVKNAEVGTNIFLLPDDVSLEDAAFLEPLSVAVRAIRELDPDLSEPILVTGLGTIGQCVVAALAAMGAKDIVAVDTSELRREAARQSGATHVLNPLETDMVTELLDCFGRTSSPYRPESGAFGSAFECSGAAVVFDQVFKLLRPAGKVSFVGLTSEPVRIETNWVVQKELRIYGSFAYATENVKEAFDLIATRAVEPSHLITHRFDLDDIQAAFEAQTDSESSVKVMVRSN